MTKIKDFTDSKVVLSYLSNTEYIYTDIILAEYNGESFGLLINANGANRIKESAEELVAKGFGDVQVLDSIEQDIRNIFSKK